MKNQKLLLKIKKLIIEIIQMYNENLQISKFYKLLKAKMQKLSNTLKQNKNIDKKK